MTQRQYLTALTQFLAWLLEKTIASRTREQWDHLLLDRIQHLWDEGAPRALAERTIANLMWAAPSLRGKPSISFPNATAAVAGWLKQEPGMSRPPVPFIVARAIAMFLLQAKKPLHSLAIVFLFETYFRASEGLATLALSIVPPAPMEARTRQCVAILAMPTEMEEVSKTGETDISVLLDLPRQADVGKVLIRLAATIRQMERVFPISYQELRQALMYAVAELKLDGLSISLHGLRHGGASHDRSSNERTAAEVQMRGGWRQATSVKRYEKAARLNRQLALIPEVSKARVYQLAKQLNDNFEKLYAEQLKLPPLAASY